MKKWLTKIKLEIYVLGNCNKLKSNVFRKNSYINSCFSENKKLCIRITYVSVVRKTKIGDVISFHGMDESGEISFFTLGESCNSIYKYLKVKSCDCEIKRKERNKDIS